MFRERGIHSASVRLGWYCHSKGVMGNFGKIKINAYLFIPDMLI